jgi:hypothetical protein
MKYLRKIWIGIEVMTVFLSLNSNYSFVHKNCIQLRDFSQ